MHKHLILHWASQSIKVIWEKTQTASYLHFALQKHSYSSAAGQELQQALPPPCLEREVIQLTTRLEVFQKRW